MKFKKAISFALSLIMLLGCMLPVLGAIAAEPVRELPVVYVVGKGLALYDENGTRIYPFEKSVLDSVKENIAEIGLQLAVGALTDDWDGYCDALVNAILPVHSPVLLNNNGEVDNGTHCAEQRKPTRKTQDFSLDEYSFVYDWRLDPFETAKQLDEYIDAVLSETGKSKVNIIGRCYGSNILSAYFAEYGYSKIDHCLLYVPTAFGTKLAGAMFSGSIELNCDTIERYLYSAVDYENDPLMAVLTSLVTVLNEVNTLGFAAELVEKIYDKVKENVLPRLVLGIYGTMPSYWAMINDEYYDKAKAVVFDGKEEEYSGLIEKADRYHYSVMQNVDEIYREARKNGVRISIVCKYNVPYAPIIEGAKIMADDSVETTLSSFGATCADYTEVLPESYINSVTAEGNGRYISKDKKIDASTCTYADTTWFVRDIKHGTFVKSMNELIIEIFNTKMTVEDNERFPQFMVWDEETETISPITGEDSRDSIWTKGRGAKFIDLLAKFIKLVVSLLFKSE